MKLLSALCCVSLVSLFSCGQRSTEDSNLDGFIVGGTEVKAGSPIAKHTVSLMDNDNAVFCTGTLISETAVVTAAHCLKDLPFKPKIGFGLNATKAEVVKVKAYKINPDYIDLENTPEDEIKAPPSDIAVIRLVSKAPQSAQVAPVLELKSDLVVSEEFVLAGFGMTNPYNDDGVGVLRTVKTKIKVAKKEFKEIEFGGRPGKSACMGDSGGPAFVRRNGKLHLTGVTSRGSGLCDEEGVYTDIRYFREWMSKELAAM